MMRQSAQQRSGSFVNGVGRDFPISLVSVPRGRKLEALTLTTFRGVPWNARSR